MGSKSQTQLSTHTYTHTHLLHMIYVYIYIYIFNGPVSLENRLKQNLLIFLPSVNLALKFSVNLPTFFSVIYVGLNKIYLYPACKISIYLQWVSSLAEAFIHKDCQIWVPGSLPDPKQWGNAYCNTALLGKTSSKTDDTEMTAAIWWGEEGNHQCTACRRNAASAHWGTTSHNMTQQWGVEKQQWTGCLRQQ